MRNRIMALTLLLTLSLVGLAAVQAQAVQVQITSPEINQVVRGRVPIIGSASVDNFQFYKVEFGVGSDPSQWAVVGQLHDSPVINGQLEVWDTSGVPDGVYSLQLQAVKQDGNWESFFVRGVTVSNSSPTETPTPEVTPTEMPTTPLYTESASPEEPRATATIQIITPSADLQQATPTATPCEAWPMTVASYRSIRPTGVRHSSTAPPPWGPCSCCSVSSLECAACCSTAAHTTHALCPGGPRRPPGLLLRVVTGRS